MSSEYMTSNGGKHEILATCLGSVRWVGLLVWTLTCLHSEGMMMHPPQATGQITLEVVNSQGKPVPGAKCRVAFVRSDADGDHDLVEGETDDEGHFCAQGRAYQEAVITVTNEGYYGTLASYEFTRPPSMGMEVEQRVNLPHHCLEIYPPQNRGELIAGKWGPWNPIVRLTLKEKRKRIALCLTHKRIWRSEPGRPAGFDLEKGAWVAPYGDGEHADIVLGWQISETNGDQQERKSFVFYVPGASNGLVRMKRDAWSGLSSEYEAPEEGYVPDLGARTGEGARQDLIWPEDEYLFVRCRVELDSKGRIVHANYAKLYGMRCAPDGDLLYLNTGPIWFNPVDGDRNLEYDADRNLNPKGYRHYDSQ